MILPNKTRFARLLANARFRLGAALSMMLGITLATGAELAPASPATVGEISLVIGSARRVDAAGTTHAVARGQTVQVGDRIETEDGGHVHLRFSDGAFVSVRPGSRLVIETYQYAAARPQDSAIRFRLEQGVARAITGKGGQAARERFRLNTPIAAIGVKGTDFVVQASLDAVRVAVHSGAIIMAPIGAGCLSEAFGPCQTDAARTLTADMGRVMLEFNRLQGTPRVIPVNGLLSPDRITPATPDEPRAAARRNEANTETLAARTVEAGQGLPPPLPPATLVWGRWPWDAALPGDTQSVSYYEGRQGGARTLVTGNEYYIVFRPAADAAAHYLAPTLGRADFTLRDAQAHYLPNNVPNNLQNVASRASVHNGWLSVDFGARQFATGLTLDHAATGSVPLAATGRIDHKGQFLYSNHADTRLAGTLSLDSKEAAYTFVREANNGNLVGITRWAR